MTSESIYAVDTTPWAPGDRIQSDYAAEQMAAHSMRQMGNPDGRVTALPEKPRAAAVGRIAKRSTTNKLDGPALS